MSRISQLIGPNAVGKTQLLEGLAGFPSSRRAFTANYCLPARIGHTVSILGQGIHKNIFSSRVRTLLTAPLVYSGLTLTEAMTRTTQLLDTFSFDYLLDRDFYSLSGGEKHFVALFSCLTTKSSLFLLDDPLLMLDRSRSERSVGILNAYFADTVRAHAIVAVSRPDLYSQLSTAHYFHVGYSPNSVSCLSELRLLLNSLNVDPLPLTTLNIRNMTVAPYGKDLLLDVSARLPSNAMYLVVGSNGTGKTSLLRTLSGQLPPRRGSALMENDRSAEKLVAGENVLYVPQEPTGLIGFRSVSAELGFEEAPAWWRQVLDFLIDWRLLETNRLACEGSFGEVRFRAILAALSGISRSPRMKVLLLDEPDASLDELRLGVLSLLLRWLSCTRCWVGAVTHRPEGFIDPVTSDVGDLRQLSVRDCQLEMLPL